MKRLTYQTVGDATRQAHYCAGYGVKKDDVVQRLGEYEDTGLTPEEIRQALCLLRLAADDLEIAMSSSKCHVCSAECCDVEAVCRWRGADEVEEFLGGNDDDV